MLQFWKSKMPVAMAEPNRKLRGGDGYADIQQQSNGRETSQEAGKDHHAASHLHDTYEWSRHTRGGDAN